MGEIIKAEGRKLSDMLAEKYHCDKEALLETVRSSIYPGSTDEQLFILLHVMNKYDLDPFASQITAFTGDRGKVCTIVEVDGWIKIVNEQPTYDGVAFTYQEKDGKLEAVTAAVHVKGRSVPIEATEWMSECVKNTEPWKKWPRRMLRHKAFIQAARYAFGIGGIYDPDEGDRIREATDAEAIETNTKAKLTELEDRVAAAKGLNPPTVTQEAAVTTEIPQAAVTVETPQSASAEAEEPTPEWIEGKDKDKVLDEIFTLAESMKTRVGVTTTDEVLHEAGLARFSALKKQSAEKVAEAYKALQDYEDTLAEGETK